MGWSCSMAAAATMDRWIAACVKQTGASGTWEEGGVRYFFEPSRHEHRDGAITGKVYRMGPPTEPDGGGPCYPAGSFRINADGSVARAPRFLKGVSGTG